MTTLAMRADPNLQDFHGRLRRIEAIHARGRRFEAPGTLGAPPRRRPARRLSLILPLLALALGITVLKAAIHANIGPESYGIRIERLASGDAFARAAALVMQADPVTVAASGLVRGLLPR